MVKSYEKFSKIMASTNTKRDYIISNPNIAEKDIIKLVRLYDYIIDRMDYTYDLIIKENGIDRSKIDLVLKEIQNKTNNIWRNKNG